MTISATSFATGNVKLEMEVNFFPRLIDKGKK